MIIAKLKETDELKKIIQPYKKILLLKCTECTKITLAAVEMRIKKLLQDIKKDLKIEVVEFSLQKQCDFEKRIEEILQAKMAGCDAVLSIGCGEGIQVIAERIPHIHIVPALDTKVIGSEEEIREHKLWVQKYKPRCICCGDCVLGFTGGICPMTGCAKNLLNGPCGGSEKGRCEISDEDKEISCAWQKIYDRLSSLNRLDLMEEILPPKSWETSQSRKKSPKLSDFEEEEEEI